MLQFLLKAMDYRGVVVVDGVVNRTMSGWFALGVVVGMMLCVVLVVEFVPSITESVANVEVVRYETRVLATPPWVEPQVCHLAKIHEGNPGQECTPEGPTTDASWLDVSRDTIFQGSLMFAGLVLFGSVFLKKAVPAKRKDVWYRKFATFGLFEGTLLLAALHVFFSGTGELILSVSDMMWITVALMGVIYASYTILTWNQES